MRLCVTMASCPYSKHFIRHRYEDASLEYAGVNRHAFTTRIGLMDRTVSIEALLDYDKK